MLIVFTTTLSTEAEKLAKAIIESRLAACVQIIPMITSIYVWECNIHKENESLLLIKTLPENYDALEAYINANHTYDVPEIVAVDAERVSESYLGWLSSVIKDKRAQIFTDL
jgi:periplasmic divalent cation tolerance protein